MPRVFDWLAPRGLGCLLLLALAAPALGQRLDEMSLDRWQKLSEAQRYQFNIAEKLYREQNWKSALGEYEKFVTLYEQADAAPHAQLKWSLCQQNLRKHNTAIKDGFQSVLDYWPDSPDAVAAGYFMGRAYRESGENALAKKHYANVAAKHPASLAALYARVDLAALAELEGDQKRVVEIWTDIVFHADRQGAARQVCVETSQKLAAWRFGQGDFENGRKALETSHPDSLPYHVYHFVRGPIHQQTQAAETKDRGLKVADAAVALMRAQRPADLKDDAAKTQFRQFGQWIAEIEHYAGRHAEGVKALDEVLARLGPDDDTLGRKASLLKAHNQRDEARAQYARYQNQAEGQHQIAHSHREERNYEPAIAIYKTLLTQDAQNVGRWQWELAGALRDAGKFQEAIGVFRACDNFPEDLKQLAYCHRRLNQPAEARGLYQQVIAGHEPSAAWALLETAYTYEEQSQPESAIKALQQVCRRYPKTSEASTAHTRLNNQYKINITLGGAKED